jgi:dihydroflavonol-4-reductase
MAHALITGGTGFVGSHLARALTEAGHTVRVLHRPSSKLTALDGVRFESALGDVLELDALRAACTGCDWVFHVAAVADYWRADPKHMREVNVEGTRRVLQAAREAGVKRVVFTSSAAAVGLTEGGASDERVPFNLPPERFPYGHSKVLAEQVVAEAVAGGQAVVTVNPVIVIGPGDLNQISGSMVIESKRNGRFVPVAPGGAAYVDVRDVARWQVRAAEVGVVGERYLLGTANIGHREWFNMIADVVGVPRPILPLPKAILPVAAGVVNVVRRLGVQTPVDGNQILLSGMGVYFKYDKAWAAFGAPQVAMEMSLQDTYAWYRASGVI